MAAGKHLGPVVALGHIGELDWLHDMCDVPRLADILKRGESDPDFVLRATTRDKGVILDAQDLTMRIHWAIRDAWINCGGFLPADLDWSEDYEMAHVSISVGEAGPSGASDPSRDRDNHCGSRPASLAVKWATLSSRVLGPPSTKKPLLVAVSQSNARFLPSPSLRSRDQPINPIVRVVVDQEKLGSRQFLIVGLNQVSHSLVAQFRCCLMEPAGRELFLHCLSPLQPLVPLNDLEILVRNRFEIDEDRRFGGKPESLQIDGNKPGVPGLRRLEVAGQGAARDRES